MAYLYDFVAAQGPDDCHVIVAEIRRHGGPRIMLSMKERAPGSGEWTEPTPIGAPSTDGMWVGKVGSIGANEDGRLEVAFLNDLEVWRTVQTGTGDEWSPWTTLEAPPEMIQSSPTLASTEDGRLQLFVLAGAGELWTRRQFAVNGATWTSWASLGRPGRVTSWSTAPVVVVRNADFRMEVFARFGGSVWHCWQTGANDDDWSAWADLGRPDAGEPGAIVAAQHKDAALRVFTVVKGQLWQRRQLRPGFAHWSAWWPEGTRLDGRAFHLALAHRHDGGLLVVAPEAPDELSVPRVFSWQEHPPGATFVTTTLRIESSASHIAPTQTLWRPAVLATTDRRMRVFLQAGDTGVYCLTQAEQDGDTWHSTFLPIGDRDE